jgi:alkaline phosphatase D
MMKYVLAIALTLAAFGAAAGPVGYPRAMQGPMVGAVTPTEIPVWIRASGPFECWLEYGEDPTLAEPLRTERVTASKDNDYCVVLRMSGLKPATRYHYRVYVHEGIADGFGNFPPFSAQTAPEERFSGRVRVSFGSCSRWREDPVQPIWQAVEDLEPDLFFWIGDNIYGDALDPDILAEEYRRQREVVGLQPLLRTVPHLATWDDHDFGINNSDRTSPVKEGALKVFKQYWANPAFGLPDTPGVFCKYSYGPVDFFFLDGRYYRDPNEAPDIPGKTHLGAAQLAWLKQGLKESGAVFKVLISGSGFNGGKGPGADSWESYLHERTELLNYIRDEEVGGVLLMSGDTHVGELNAIPWSDEGGYDFYELVSSPLAQAPASGNLTRGPMMRLRPAYCEAGNAGLMDFDFSGEVPTVTMNVMTQYGFFAWEPLTIRADELVNGKATAKKKQSKEARDMERFSAGGRSALKAGE